MAGKGACVSTAGRRLIGVASVVLIFGGEAAAQDDGTPALLPHRAVYELRLDSVADRSQIVAAGGDMAVSWEASCEGWTIDQRYRLAFTYAEGGDVELVTTYASWESRDGGSFSFTSRTTLNGVVEEEIRGHAALTPEGGSAHYRLPAERDQALPAGTYFPTGHTRALLRRAEAGAAAFTAPLFDGTRADGLTEVSAAISAPAGGDRPAPQEGPAILEGRAFWPVQLAFFDPDQADPEPDHEVGFRLYRGGIVDGLLINYGDFVLRGRAAAIEALPLPDDC